MWFINPHNNNQSNNYICAVFLNCFCIVSHFSQNSNTIHGIYTLLIQVHISAPMYRSRSGKSLKKISLKKLFPPISVYYNNNFSSLEEIKHQKRYWYSEIKMKYVSFYISFILVSNLLMFIRCYSYNKVTINVCFRL